jgi:hypothetical protein
MSAFCPAIDLTGRTPKYKVRLELEPNKRRRDGDKSASFRHPGVWYRSRCCVSGSGDSWMLCIAGVEKTHWRRVGRSRSLVGLV